MTILIKKSRVYIKSRILFALNLDIPFYHHYEIFIIIICQNLSIHRIIIFHILIITRNIVSYPLLI